MSNTRRSELVNCILKAVKENMKQCVGFEGVEPKVSSIENGVVYINFYKDNQPFLVTSKKPLEYLNVTIDLKVEDRILGVVYD